MATHLLALGACISRMTSGEKCLAKRLENAQRQHSAAQTNHHPSAQFAHRNLCHADWNRPRLLPGDTRVGRMSAIDEDETEIEQLFYVATSQAIQKLLVIPLVGSNISR